jgi:hypothetical protein
MMRLTMANRSKGAVRQPVDARHRHHVARADFGESGDAAVDRSWLRSQLRGGEASLDLVLAKGRDAPVAAVPYYLIEPAGSTNAVTGQGRRRHPSRGNGRHPTRAVALAETSVRSAGGG